MKHHQAFHPESHCITISLSTWKAWWGTQNLSVSPDIRARLNRDYSYQTALGLQRKHGLYRNIIIVICLTWIFAQFAVVIFPSFMHWFTSFRWMYVQQEHCDWCVLIYSFCITGVLNATRNFPLTVIRRLWLSLWTFYKSILWRQHQVGCLPGPAERDLIGTAHQVVEWIRFFSDSRYCEVSQAQIKIIRDLITTIKAHLLDVVKLFCNYR